MKKRKLTWLTATVVAVAFGMTAFVGPATSTGRATGTTQTTQTVASSTAERTSVSAKATKVGSVIAGKATDKNAPTSAQKGWKTELAKKVIAFVKRTSSSAYNALKSAVKKGYTAVKNWYNDLAWLVRKGIDLLLTVSFEEIIRYIIDLLT